MKPMKNATFEDYLQECHAKQYEGLDDDMPDDYESWLQDLDPLQWIKLGDDYANMIRGEK